MLEAADLVTVMARGTTSTPLQRIYERWMTPFSAHLASRLLDLKERLETGTELPPGKPAPCESELPPPR